MAFTNKPHFLFLFLIYSTIVLLVSSLNSTQVPAEAPSSGGDGFYPFAKKHVIIRNTVKNREVLNVHCKSSEDDLGLIHIPWNESWGFRFRVNFSESTKFRCHFTWRGGGSHFLTYF
ncbi:unnamed protein product [Cochlearia groenlandica]